jgi:hypothetical protein
MLRRLLSGLAIASLCVGAIILSLWWRSYHHSDHFAIGKPNVDQTEYTTEAGKVWVATTTLTPTGSIETIKRSYPLNQLAAGCLIIPGFWLAITIRAKLPRPGKAPRK